ncbi:MAG: haloacid dehalogenase-like hydrolase, partial [Treponema sp.]|nr:haloacid dehalogenase-like hydrolase [Treponema sp.]
MKRRIFSVLLIVCVVAAALFVGCDNSNSSKKALDLWTEQAPAKSALAEYVKALTNKNSPDFIPVQDRIAIFDFDGTLFCETHPTYFDFQLFIHRVLDDPSYTPTAEQKKMADDFIATGKVPPLGKEYEKSLASAYKGFGLDEYCAYVKAFMQTEQPGYKNLIRQNAYYKPMVQIVDYLKQNGFTVYVSSGTNRLVLRALVCDALDLPPHQVIGSDNVLVAAGQGGKDGLEYMFADGDQIFLGGDSVIKNLQLNKVFSIIKEIGKRPVLAFGNSFTDASMLNYAIYGNKYKALAFMLCCDDLEREYGNLKKAQTARDNSEKYGWIPVSMRDDWTTIYGAGVEKTE